MQITEANIHQQFQQEVCRKPSGDYKNAIDASTYNPDLLGTIYAIESANKFLECLTSDQQKIVRKAFGLKPNESFTETTLGTSDNYIELQKLLKLPINSKGFVRLEGLIEKLGILENPPLPKQEEEFSGGGQSSQEGGDPEEGSEQEKKEARLKIL